MCFFRKEPPRSAKEKAEKHGLREYGRVFLRIWKVPSFRYNTIAMTASTFILGGVAAWAPFYIFQREARFQIAEASLQKLGDLKASDGSQVVPPPVIDKLRPLIGDRILNSADLKQQRLREEPDRWQKLSNTTQTSTTRSLPRRSTTLGKISFIFGAIVVVSGLFATLLGGMLGDRLRVVIHVGVPVSVADDVPDDTANKRFPGAYFLVAGYGCLVARSRSSWACSSCPFLMLWFVHVRRRIRLVLQHRPGQHDPGQRRSLPHSRLPRSPLTF